MTFLTILCILLLIILIIIIIIIIICFIFGLKTMEDALFPDMDSLLKEYRKRNINHLRIRGKTYRNVLEHRRNCKKWGNEFCLDCFGGGLTRFINNLNSENQNE